MRKPIPLRAELASVFGFVGKRALHVRRVIQPGGGILSELASGRGLR
jgi:hypothetical protein